ncbi:MAG: N-acetylneuraminate synthase [bacterium]
MRRVYVIAEAGVNHNGSIDLARQMIKEAKAAGADAVKFQTFKADNLVMRLAEMAEYQKKNSAAVKSQYDMLKGLELSFADFKELKGYADEIGIDFLSTPFDTESLFFLAHELQMPIIKLSSGEITNAKLLFYAGQTGKKIFLSTGISNLGEIEAALAVLAYGMSGRKEKPCLANSYAYYALPEAQELLQKNVVLLHCTTEYPAPLSEVNLASIQVMQKAFNLPIGFSDHTVGDTAAAAATALGAVVIEKHFTLDKNMPGPDHKASLNSDELKAMIERIRQTECILGDGRKVPSFSELKNKAVIRKSLVTSKPIACGQLFTADNLAVKRPGNGVSALYYWDYLGKKADKDYKCEEQVR